MLDRIVASLTAGVIALTLIKPSLSSAKVNQAKIEELTGAKGALNEKGRCV